MNETAAVSFEDVWFSYNGTNTLAMSMITALVAVAGLWLSWMSNLPSGATTVLLAAAMFFVAFVIRRR